MTQQTLADYDPAHRPTNTGSLGEVATGQPSPFAPGDRVCDEQDPEGVAIVLDPAVGRCDEVTVTGTDSTVAAFAGNGDYPSDDPVVRVVYEVWLDRHSPGWRDQSAEEIPRWLATYTSKWQIPKQTYDYPASRLRPVDSEA